MMRSSLRCILSLVVLVAATPESRAEFGSPQSADLGRNGEAVLEYRFRQRLTELSRTAATETERDWYGRMATIYGERKGAPIWVDRSGLNARARTVAAELARAGDWALDPTAFAVPNIAPTSQPLSLTATINAEIEMSLAVVKYAWHANGGRVDPSELSRWMDQKPQPVDASLLLQELATSNDPAAVLRAAHPQHPEFGRLLRTYHALQSPPESDPVMARLRIRIPSGPRISPGDSHPHVALVRQRLGMSALAGEEETYDPALVTAVSAYMRKNGYENKAVIDSRVRRSLNGELQKREAARKDSRSTVRKILVNLERWRWMPRELADFHIWNNLPQFETRIIKNGQVIHQERIIIGKADTQTPIFTNYMRYVVFQPDWVVPGSIKVTSLLPKLQSGDHEVISRRDMRIVGKDGKERSPECYNWSKVDIRSVLIVQNPGPGNPLGQVKFLFPNKHDVYMHDTPDKHLFANGVRTHSHGCIRVRNPKRLAEVVLGEDKGWSANEIKALLTSRKQTNNKIELDRRIPVYNTYFTMRVDEDGSLHSLSDHYGHDKRVSAVLLDGKSPAAIARNDPAVIHERAIKEAFDDARSSGRSSRDDSGDDDGEQKPKRKKRVSSSEQAAEIIVSKAVDRPQARIAPQPVTLPVVQPQVKKSTFQLPYFSLN